MKYTLTYEKKTEFNKGDFLVDQNENLFLIVFDDEQGYALLEMETCHVHTDFFESIDEMQHYNDISGYKLAKQINNLEFRVSE